MYKSIKKGSKNIKKCNRKIPLSLLGVVISLNISLTLRSAEGEGEKVPSGKTETQEQLEQEQEVLQKAEAERQAQASASVKTGTGSTLAPQAGEEAGTRPSGRSVTEVTPPPGAQENIPGTSTEQQVPTLPALAPPVGQEARTGSQALADQVASRLQDITTLSAENIPELSKAIEDYQLASNENPNTVLEQFDTIKTAVQEALSKAGQAENKQAIDLLVSLQLTAVYKDRDMRYAIIVPQAQEAIHAPIIAQSNPDQLITLFKELEALNRELEYLKNGFGYIDISRVPSSGGIYSQFTDSENKLLGILGSYTAQQLYKLLGLSDYATTQEVKDAVAKIVAQHPTEENDLLGLAAREAGNLIGNPISKAFYDAYLAAEGSDRIKSFNDTVQITQAALEFSFEKSREAAQLQQSISELRNSVDQAMVDKGNDLPPDQLVTAQPESLGWFARIRQGWKRILTFLTNLTSFFRTKTIGTATIQALAQAERVINDINKITQDLTSNNTILIRQTNDLINELENEQITISNIITLTYRTPNEPLLLLERTVLETLQNRLSNQRNLLEDIQKGFAKQVLNADIINVSSRLDEAIESYPNQKPSDVTYNALTELYGQVQTLGLKASPNLMQQLDPAINNLKQKEQVVARLLSSPTLQASTQTG